MPTPNDMPGATATEEQPAEQEHTNGSAQAEETEADPDGLDSAVTDPQAEIDRLRNLVRRGRQWEKTARKNAENAKQWEKNAERVRKLDELEAAQRTKEENLTAERDRLLQELAAERTETLRNRIAAETKVPARFLVGATETEMREAAQDYIDARNRDIEEHLRSLNISPAAPANQVTSDGKPTEVKQLTRAELQTMSRKDILAAQKAGQLDDLIGRSRS